MWKVYYFRTNKKLSEKSDNIIYLNFEDEMTLSQISHIEGSINIISKYLKYLEQAYVINEIKPYSTKTKNELSSYFKSYDEDVSFNSIRCMDNRYDLTHNLQCRK